MSTQLQTLAIAYKKGTMTQKAEPRFYKVESRAVENNSRGTGLSHKQRKMATCIRPNFRILWTSDCFVPLIITPAEWESLSFDRLPILCCECVDRWLIYLVHRLSDLKECIQGIIPEEPHPHLNGFRRQVPGPWAWAWCYKKMIFLGRLLGGNAFILQMTVT